MATVTGESTNEPGLVGISNSNDGVRAVSTSGNGLSAFSETNVAIYAKAKTKPGVYAEAESEPGVVGISNSNDGVRATSKSGNGLSAFSDKTGLYAKGTVNAGFFEGNVAVTGNLVVKGTDISTLISQVQSLGNLVGRVQGLEGRVQTLEQENQRLKQEVVGIKQEVAGIKNQSSGGKLPAGSPNPQISVTKKEGKFVVTGSGFLANTEISIRAVENNPQNYVLTSQSSESDGALSVQWSLNCIAGTPLSFSASDGRVISGNQLWSNTFKVTC